MNVEDILSLKTNTVAQDGEFGHGFVLHLSDIVFNQRRGLGDCGLHVYSRGTRTSGTLL